MKSAITVVNVLFDDRYGGPQRRVIDVGVRLRQSGIETILCLPSGAGTADTVAADAGIKVRRIAMERVPNPRDPARVLRWTACAPRDLSRFIRLLRQERPDVVHVNGAFFVLPAFAAKLVGIPLVWHLNDTLVPPNAARMLGRLVRLTADRVIVAAKAVAEHYGVTAAPHAVVHAPVDVTRFRSRDGIDRAGEWRVGVLANWNPLKGLEYLIPAIARARDEITSPVRVQIAGSRLDSHRAYAAHIDDLVVRYGLSKVIDTLGFVEDVPALLSQLDVIVMSSISEASPMAVLEGMAAGLPVIATDVGGVREMLLGDEGPAGIIVPPRSPVAIAEALVRLNADRSLARTLGRAGAARARRLFSLDACARRHRRVYESIYKRGSASADGTAAAVL